MSANDAQTAPDFSCLMGVNKLTVTSKLFLHWSQADSICL